MPIYQSQLYQRLLFDYVQLSFLTAQLLFVSANRLGLTKHGPVAQNLATVALNLTL